MSYKALQTAAARVVHVNNPSRKDAAELATEMHLHPLDIEGIFGAHQHPEATSFNDYCQLTLTLPFRISGKISLHEIQLFIGTDFLVLVHDSPERIIHEFFQEIRVPQVTVWRQESAGGLLLEVLSRLVKQSIADVASEHTTKLAHLYQTIYDALYEFNTLLEQRQLLPLADHSAAMHLILHRVKHEADQLLPVESALQALPARARAPVHIRMVTGYAVASVVMLLSVVWAIK